MGVIFTPKMQMSFTNYQCEHHTKSLLVLIIIFCVSCAEAELNLSVRSWSDFVHFTRAHANAVQSAKGLCRVSVTLPATYAYHPFL